MLFVKQSSDNELLIHFIDLLNRIKLTACLFLFELSFGKRNAIHYPFLAHSARLHVAVTRLD